MRTQTGTQFLSKEELVLLHGARTDDADLHGIRDALGSEPDWEYLTRNALYHGVAPLLYRNLEGIDDVSLVPERVTAVLRERYYITLARNMIHYEELGTALRVFADAGIDVIVLKGGALAETVYRDIGLRPFSDVDILVREEDMQRAKEVMTKIGYVLDERISPEAHNEEFGCDLHYIINGGHVLEIHWHIARKTGNDRYTRILIDELWKRALPARIADVDTLVLSPEDLLLHLCIHLPRHRYNRLIWFCDIAEVVRQGDVDWDRLVDTAKECRAMAYMYYGLHFTDYLLGCDVPASVLDELKPSRFERKVFESIPRDLLPDKNNVLQINPMLKMFLIDRTFDRLRYLWEYFFPPIGVLARSYSVSGSRVYLYYIVHPLHLGIESIRRLLSITGSKVRRVSGSDG